MRICHVNLASGYSGGENQTLNLIRHQLQSGYQLAVVANPKSPFYQRCTELDVELYPCTQFLLQHSRSLSKSFPIIHTHEGKAIYWALIQHLLFKTPYLITRRVDNPLKDKFLLKQAYLRASKAVALSRAIKQSIQLTLPQITPDIIPSSPVHYQVDESQREALNKHWVPGKFSVIQVGKLYGHKGFDLTIEAARSIQSKGDAIQFYLIGDGPEEEALKQAAQGLTNLKFVGKQTNMGAWFEAADVLIHPSYSEGLGSVMLEASAAGLPLIGANAGGIPDIVDHEANGLLFEKGNAEQLESAIERMHQDAELRATIERRAPIILERFSIERCAQHYEAIYHSLS